MTDSLIIAENIELIGTQGGTPSTIPACLNATFQLLAPSAFSGAGSASGFDLGAPQPTTDIIGSLLLDGERPFGYRASNRTITLPIIIKAPDFQTLIAAREVLLQEVDQQTWSLRWTRDTAGAFAGNSTALPLLFDCFRAQPTIVSWGAFYNRIPYGVLTLTFQAMPYGRSDTPNVIDFPSPLSGVSSPAAAVTIDDFTSVSGTQWAANANSVDGTQCAFWSSAIAPASSSTGIGVPATYSKSGLTKNLTGLQALTLWTGLGSTSFFTHFNKLGGRVRFSFTLTDNAAHVLKFHKIIKLSGSNQNGAPKWTKIRVPFPTNSATFSYANVTAYSVTITNRSAPDGLAYTRFYMDTLKAVPNAVTQPSPQRGVCYDMSGLIGSARAPISLQAQQGGTTSAAQKFAIPGTIQWLCPAGVTTVDVWAIGGGGGSGDNVHGTNDFGGGGGGAGSAHNASVAVTAGNVYTVKVGKPGTGGVFGGAGAVSGGTSTFQGDSVTVTGNGGNSSAANSTTGGTAGAAGTGGQAGGAGGLGGSPGGGGGGGSGGTTGAGGAGGTGAGGGAAGAAGAGTLGLSATGGVGGTSTRSSLPGNQPGGGGGGTCASTGGTHAGKPGAAGLVQLTYTLTPTFQTLVVHRPPITAPDMLAPFVQMQTTDVPDNTTVYQVQSLDPALSARFQGTYTVVIVAWAWNTPANSRTITVTVNEIEQLGGASYSTSVSTSVIPNNLASTPGTNAQHGPFVILGEITLPVQEIPPENKNAYYTVTVNDTNTSDDFLDVLFLDTMGSTVMITSPTAYVNYFLDEPSVDRDIGLVLGSVFDRDDAISVLDRALITGGPMTMHPFGSPTLLLYAAEGAPAAQVLYFPRWYLDRMA